MKEGPDSENGENKNYQDENHNEHFKHEKCNRNRNVGTVFSTSYGTD